MPRANRCFIPAQVWHITQRCHKKEFLLKFKRDRVRWLHWLFEAKKRYGLTVLDYIVTSNHIHLLVEDGKHQEVARSMQLIAGRTAQEYNRRKKRQGALWSDRYHTTAIDTHEYLIQCLVYIDLNMVRAGKVTHPSKWDQSGYNEIQNPPRRYQIINRKRLCELTGAKNLCLEHAMWVTEALTKAKHQREGQWSDSLAIGGKLFIECYMDQVDSKANSRKISVIDGCHVVQETPAAYSTNIEVKNSRLKPR